MNFAHGELYMLGAYAGIAVIGLTHSFWAALVVAPLAVGAIGALTEVTTLRPLYRRRAPLRPHPHLRPRARLSGKARARSWGGDMRRILPPFTGSTPLLGMTYPNYRLFLLAAASVLLLAIWLFFTRTRAGIVVRAAVQDAEMLDGLGVKRPARLHPDLRRLGRPGRAGRAPARADLHGLPADGRRDDPPRVHRRDPRRHGIDGRLGRRPAFVIGLAQSLLTLWMNPQRVAIAIFAIMIVVLIARPRGFFGREGVLE